MLFHSKLPKYFWSYAILHATFIINRLPTPVSGQKSPFEMLHNQPPTYLEFKVFGCLAYASTLMQNRTKLNARARKCIFLGLKLGYVLFAIQTRDIFISRNVFFSMKLSFHTLCYNPHMKIISPLTALPPMILIFCLTLCLLPLLFLLTLTCSKVIPLISVLSMNLRSATYEDQIG